MKKFRYWFVVSISLFLFWLPGSIESHKGFFVKLLKRTFKRVSSFWTQLKLPPPEGQIFSAVFVPKKHCLSFSSHMVYVHGLTKEFLDIYHKHLVIGLYHKDENIYAPDTIIYVPSSPIYPLRNDGCNFSISNHFFWKNRRAINDGKHVFVAYVLIRNDSKL